MRRNLNRSIAGKRIIGSPLVGVPGRKVPEDGEDFPSLLANERSQPEDADNLFRLRVISSTFPARSLWINEDGSFRATSLPDGIYSLLYRVEVNGVPSLTDVGLGPGSAVFNLRVGAADNEPVYQARAEFDRWLPFVLPQAPHIPRDTAIHHIRQAAIKFCEGTHAWQDELPTVVSVAGLGQYEPTMPREAAPVKLFSFWMNDQECKCVEITAGRRTDRLGTPGSLPVAYMVNRTSIGVAPPTASAGIKLRFALSFKPAQAAEAVPEELFEQYADAIASGALATLLRLPGAGKDDREAAIQGDAFAAHIDRVKAQVQAGFARTSKRTTSVWF